MQTVGQQIARIKEFFNLRQDPLREDAFLTLVAQLTEIEAIRYAFNLLVGNEPLENSTQEARRQALAETVGIIGKVVNALVTPQGDAVDVTEAQRARARKFTKDLFFGHAYRPGLQLSKFPYALIDEVNFITDGGVVIDFLQKALPYTDDYLRAYPTLEALASALNRARLAEARQTLLSLLCNDKIINRQLLADTQALTLLLGLLDKPQELIDALRRAESPALVRRLEVNGYKIAMPMQTRVAADRDEIQTIACQIMAAADDPVQTRIIVAKALQRAGDPRAMLLLITQSLYAIVPPQINVDDIAQQGADQTAYEQAKVIIAAARHWIMQSTAQVDRRGSTPEADKSMTRAAVIHAGGETLQPAWHGMAYQHSLLADKDALIAYANQLPAMFAVALLLQPDIFKQHVKGYENFIALSERLENVRELLLVQQCVAEGGDFITKLFPKQAKGIRRYLIAARRRHRVSAEGINREAARELINSLGAVQNKAVRNALLEDVRAFEIIAHIDPDFLRDLLQAETQYRHDLSQRGFNHEACWGSARGTVNTVITVGSVLSLVVVMAVMYADRHRRNARDWPVPMPGTNDHMYLDSKTVYLCSAFLAACGILILQCTWHTHRGINYTGVARIVRRRGRVAGPVIEDIGALVEEVYQKNKPLLDKHLAQVKAEPGNYEYTAQRQNALGYHRSRGCFGRSMACVTWAANAPSRAYHQLTDSTVVEQEVELQHGRLPM